MKKMEKIGFEANDNGRAQVIEFQSITRDYDQPQPIQEPGQVIEFQSIAQRGSSNDPELPPAA